METPGEFISQSQGHPSSLREAHLDQGHQIGEEPEVIIKHRNIIHHRVLVRQPEVEGPLWGGARALQVLADR